MYYTTVVKVVADESPERPLSGLEVCLYDHDLFSADDLLGKQVTDGNGEARFQYTSDNFVDMDDRVRGQLPDLYVVVNGSDGKQVASSRAEMIENTPQKYMTVRVSAGEANRPASAG